MGRAKFSNQLEIVRVLNQYMNSQTLKPKQTPKLTRPLGNTGHFTGVVSPYDSILLDVTRFYAWHKFQKTPKAKDVLPNETTGFTP